MLQGWVIVLASFLYLGILFAIAWYADRRADTGRSLIASPVVYALSLGVYCTTWTFYGSVGRAAACCSTGNAATSADPPAVRGAAGTGGEATA